MVGSHVLGQYFPCQRSTFTLTKAIYYLFASTITYFWNAKVTSPPPPQTPWAQVETTDPLIGYCYINC